MRAALARLPADLARVALAGHPGDAGYAGPLAAGMTPFLIDPGHRHEIPAGRRLTSPADLVARLRDHDWQARIWAGCAGCGAAG
jgi:hypothetical protein